MDKVITGKCDHCGRELPLAELEFLSSTESSIASMATNVLSGNPSGFNPHDNEILREFGINANSLLCPICKELAEELLKAEKQLFDNFSSS